MSVTITLEVIKITERGTRVVRATVREATVNAQSFVSNIFEQEQGELCANDRDACYAMIATVAECLS